MARAALVVSSIDNVAEVIEVAVTPILVVLTNSFPVHYFFTPWKHQKALRFSDVFRRLEKGCFGNEWVKNSRASWRISANRSARGDSPKEVIIQVLNLQITQWMESILYYVKVSLSTLTGGRKIMTTQFVSSNTQIIWKINMRG